MAIARLRRIRDKLRARTSQRDKRYSGPDGLDEKLERYTDWDGGVFAEAGANDGLAQSNTAFFEEFRGWRGLLVEPIPDLAARCRVNRPRSVVENCALVPLAADNGSVAMTYCGLMSVVDGGWADPGAARAHVEAGLQGHATAPDSAGTGSARAPCRPFG